MRYRVCIEMRSPERPVSLLSPEGKRKHMSKSHTTFVLYLFRCGGEIYSELWAFFPHYWNRTYFFLYELKVEARDDKRGNRSAHDNYVELMVRIAYHTMFGLKSIEVMRRKKRRLFYMPKHYQIADVLYCCCSEKPSSLSSSSISFIVDRIMMKISRCFHPSLTTLGCSWKIHKLSVGVGFLFLSHSKKPPLAPTKFARLCSQVEGN